MKQNKTLLILALGCLMFSFSGLFAVAFNHAAAQTRSGPITLPADPEQNTTIDQRVAARKISFKVAVNPTMGQAIAAKCVLAQTAAGVVKTKDSSARAIRSQTYIDVATKLANTVENITNQRLEVSDLGSAQTKFNGSVNKYLTDVGDYKAAMDDLVTMDCGKDPGGFMSTLLAARALRASLANDAVTVKSNMGLVVKELNNIKSQLPKKGSK